MESGRSDPIIHVCQLNTVIKKLYSQFIQFSSEYESSLFPNSNKDDATTTTIYSVYDKYMWSADIRGTVGFGYQVRLIIFFI